MQTLNGVNDDDAGLPALPPPPEPSRATSSAANPPSSLPATRHAKTANASAGPSSVPLSVAAPKDSKKRSSAEDTIEAMFEQREKTAKLRFDEEMRHRREEIALTQRRVIIDEQLAAENRRFARFRVWVESIAAFRQAGYDKEEAERLAGPRAPID